MMQSDPQPVLCGTDFYDPSKRAADTAAAFAAKMGVPLHLVHATVLPALPVLQDQIEAEAARIRQDEAVRNVQILPQVAGGNADEVLSRAAQEKQASMIVVSSLGRRGASRWLLGSVAERTALSAPVPTLVVRDAAPFLEWLRGDRPLRVFVGADFTASSDAALHWVRELRQLGPVEVIAACVDQAPDEALRLGVPWAGGCIANPPEVQAILERDLHEKVTGILGPENVEILVRGGWGPAEGQLVRMATESKADLIVAGTHQRQGLSRLGAFSVSRGLLHQAPMSVACVPAAAVVRMNGPKIRECRRVLVAVDLNEPHGFAAPFAFGTCRPGGMVHLLHVVHPTSKGAVNHPDAEAGLRALIPESQPGREITTTVEVVSHAEPARAICEAAERCNADIIAIGSHSRPGLTAKLLGSVALDVLQRSPRPVLVIRPPAE